MLAKYNLPIVKIGQAHSTITDTHNKKLKAKDKQWPSPSLSDSKGVSSKKSNKDRPRWNNFHQNLHSKSYSAQKPKDQKEQKESTVELGKPSVATPRHVPLSVSKPSNEEIEKRKNWRKMRRKLDEERMKMVKKHEVDMRKEAERISAKKKQMAREASLARQQEIQMRIKRIAEEKQQIQRQLLEDLKENSLTSKKTESSYKTKATRKQALPKFKTKKSGSPQVQQSSNENKQANIKHAPRSKSSVPTKLPKLKSRTPNTPIR